MTNHRSKRGRESGWRRRRCFVGVAVLVATLGIGCSGSGAVSTGERMVIADSLESLVRGAYDLSRADAPQRLLSLYPDSGRIISASAGHVTKTRTALDSAIRVFWDGVGRNMQSPEFRIGSSYVDVLTRDAAVMTFSYSIPHTTPMGRSHTVSGAWTMLWRRQHGRWMIVQEHLSDTPESTMSSDSLARADSVRNASDHQHGDAHPPGSRPER
jgi:ketosteroid isomerase-like protein